MPKHYLVGLAQTTLLVSPLVMGGGCTTPQLVSVEHNPHPLMLPDCRDGQMLGPDGSGSLTCLSVLVRGLSPPVCTPGTQVLTAVKDAWSGITSMDCIDKGQGLNDPATEVRISNAASNVASVASATQALLATTSGHSGYVGHSLKTTNGLIQSGNAQGIYAANLICEQDLNVPGAHLCTPFEIYNSAATAQPGDALDGSADVGPYWVYLQGWNDPAGAVFDPLAGLNENCGGYEYRTQDRRWVGMVFTFEAWQAGGPRVPHFKSSAIGGGPYACPYLYPIACCY